MDAGYKTFFPDAFIVVGISRCMSKWAAQCCLDTNANGNCYNMMSWAHQCMLFHGIPDPNSQEKFIIKLIYKRTTAQKITIITSYPVPKTESGCKVCNFEMHIEKCCFETGDLYRNSEL